MGKRVVKMSWSLQLFNLTKDSGFKSSHHQGHIHQKDKVTDEEQEKHPRAHTQ